MSVSDVTTRPATSADASAINRIYNDYIVGSHVSFDTNPWSEAERLEWFHNRTAAGFPILVAEKGTEVVGAAWVGPWRSKGAYARSVETTVVLAQSAVGSGIGTRLYSDLVESVEAAGFHRCYAIVALPNEASLALHRRLGFIEIGVLDEVGFKDGRYISTMLLERKFDGNSRAVL